jgi:5-methylcytosine-specific restriction endonuclease McrA
MFKEGKRTMKICWDMLEEVRLREDGDFRKGQTVYIYKDSCANCGEFYLTKKYRQSSFCGISCACSGENNPFFGKIHSVEIREKISKGRSAVKIDQTGILNSSYKGGIYTAGLTTYGTYKDRLSPYEDIRKQDGTEILEAKCVYCGRWFTPTINAVNARSMAINNLNQGECRLYCSENCKQVCPTYHRIKYPRGFKHTTSREVSTYLRQMVLERDNWTCQICGKTIEEIQLHVHHMDPVAQNPMFQNDMDSCITLCKICHKMVHSRIGCKYVDLRCNRETDYTKNLKIIFV